MEDRFNPTVDESQYGYVYRITHVETGKTYIGMHKIRPGESWRSYLGSGSLLRRYKEKHGDEAFTKELLGYSATFKELKALESELITQERILGGADLNLSECELGTKNYFKELDIKDEDILGLYFDDKFSLNEIVKHYGFIFTRNQLSLYLKGVKGFQERQIDSGEFTFEEKIVRNAKTGAMEKLLITSSRSVNSQCPECHKELSKSNLKRHQGSLACKSIVAGTDVCSYEGCEKLLTKATSLYCKEHYGSAIGKRNAKNFDGVDRKAAGTLGSHKRHHLTLGVCSEFCTHCVESGLPITITKAEVFKDIGDERGLSFMMKKYQVSRGTVGNWRQTYRASLES